MLPDKVIVHCKEILFSILLLYTHFYKLYYAFIHIKMATPVCYPLCFFLVALPFNFVVVVLNFKVT